MATEISDDAIMMFVIHDALRRDLEQLTRAIEQKDADDPARRGAFEAGWNVFKAQLHHHHTGEDDRLWPTARKHLAGRPDDLALLEAMEAEHDLITPAIDEIDAALADKDSAAQRLPEATATYRQVLVDHLTHEEHDALPLLESVMTPEDWRSFSRSQQKSVGLKGAVEFFPYIFSGADPDRAAQALRLFPAPLRLMVRRVWMPRFQRRQLWSA